VFDVDASTQAVIRDHAAAVKVMPERAASPTERG
jgi:hypothetical protein